MHVKLHAASYTDALNSRYRRHPAYQYIQINLQENILKSILVNMFISSLRSKIPSHQHTRYLVSRQNMVFISPALTNCITHIMPGVLAGAAWNDQQSYRLRLSCGRKSEGQVGCLCRRKRGGERSPYSLHWRIAQSSQTTARHRNTPSGESTTGVR